MPSIQRSEGRQPPSSMNCERGAGRAGTVGTRSGCDDQKTGLYEPAR
jgi:hypothetical protein